MRVKGTAFTYFVHREVHDIMLTVHLLWYYNSIANAKGIIYAAKTLICCMAKSILKRK